MAFAPAKCKNSENFTVFAPVFAQEWCEKSAKIMKMPLSLHLVFVFLHLQYLCLHSTCEKYHCYWVQKQDSRMQKPQVSGAFFACIGCTNDIFYECNIMLVWVQILEPDLLNLLVTAVSKGSSSKRVYLFAPKRFRNCTQNMSFMHPKHGSIAPETRGFCT